MRNIFIIVFIFFTSIASAATYYVATNGSDSNPGTISQPFGTWQKGFTVAQPGDIVYIRGGVYYPKGVWAADVWSGVFIQNKNGSSGKMINIWAYPGEKPILDCKNMTQPESHMGVYLRNCDYWYLKGLTIKNCIQTPGFGAHGLYLRTGDYNRFEQLDISFIGGSGLAILYEAEKNYVYNCDVHDCFDQYTRRADGTPNPGEHADGIDLASITERSGNERVNTLRGVRAWNNADDGFDHYQVEGVLIIDSCWVWHNGYNYGGTTPTGDGNGFKLGVADGTPESYVQRTVTNCIAYDNRQRGFSQENANVNMVFYNNIAFKNKLQGFAFVAHNRPDILRNNISYRNSAVGEFQSKQIHDHNSWDSGVTVSDGDFVSLDASQLMRPRKANGCLPDITFLKLVSTSDMVDKGVSVGKPYSGKAPELGPFELTSSTATALTYVSAVVENTTPSVMHMTYNTTLASILPSASSFSVKVNTVSRTVNSVSISGSKVSLNLSSPVKYGETVTVAYTKPSSNMLQSSSGSQAASMTAKTVTNNVSSVPVYVSSVIPGTTPGRVEVSFNHTMATIIPPASSFRVMVNSVARTVSSVSISGTKVLLSLSSPVAAGNIVTVAYTKPSSNPLQCTSAGQVATFSAKTVTNSLSASTSGTTLKYVGSVVENAAPKTLTITYSSTLATNFSDPSRFAVRVNSVARTVSSMAISGSKVHLYLSSPVAAGNVVQVGYTKPSSNLLVSTTGSEAPNMSLMPVVNNVISTSALSSPSPSYLSSMIENPEVVELNYNSELAPVIPPASSFLVQVNSVPVGVNSVEISGSNVFLHLDEPVESGEQIVLDYTVPAENALQGEASGLAPNLDDVIVLNNLQIKIPEFTDAVIENTAPNILKVSYSAELMNLVPDNSSFVAKVNGILEPVSEVAISSNQVLITIQNEVKHGDIITIAYIKPAVNALKAISGGAVLTFSDKTVKNKIEINPEITIYPNPASDYINISELEPSSESRLVRIFDFSGRLCVEKLLDPENINRLPINLESGTYIVQIVFGKLVRYSQKLIIN